MNGKITETEEALVSAIEPIYLGIFEGIKAYVEGDVLGSGKLNFIGWKPHIDRLWRSAAVKWFEIRYTKEEMLNATREAIKANRFDTNVYIQPRIWPNAIMGPSGSGKTIFLNLVGALDQPTEGEVVVHGTPLNGLRDLDAFRNREIGFVFQFQNLIPTLTARENVEVPMHELKISKDKRMRRAKEMLASVGLAERADHKPSQLSGGERQRVAIARALINDPAIVLADELTGELDTATGLKIVKLMSSINRERRKTFIVMTHNLEVAKRTDRIVHLRYGRIEREEAVRSELLEDLMHFRN